MITITKQDVFEAIHALGLSIDYRATNERIAEYEANEIAAAVEAARRAYPPLNLDRVREAAREAARVKFAASPYERACEAAADLLSDMRFRHVVELPLSDPWVAERAALIS